MKKLEAQQTLAALRTALVAVNSDKVAPATDKQIVKAIGKLSDNAVTGMFAKIATQVYSANSKESISITADDSDTDTE